MLLTVINTVSWVILSAAVMLYMAFFTNKYIQKSASSEDIDKSIGSLPEYRFNIKTIIAFAVLIIITGVAAFIVSTKAISVIACVKLGLCYLAVIGAAVIDIKIKIIPNIIPIALIVSRLVIFVFEMFFTAEAISYLVSSLIGCFLCGLVLFIADKVSKGGIGKGDIKLIAALGFMSGFYAVFSTLILALIVCILAAVILLLAKKKKSSDHIPFGPFIYLGYLFMILFTLY